MKHLLLAAGLLALTTSAAHAQAAAETDAVKKTITAFFDAMRKGDSTLMRSTLAPGVVLQTIDTRNGAVRIPTVKAKDMLKMVGTPHKEVYDERIRFEQVLVDANLASVWTPYQFYVDDKFSHCGYNSFQLVKMTEGWKIAYIIDTRRKDQCK